MAKHVARPSVCTEDKEIAGGMVCKLYVASTLFSGVFLQVSGQVYTEWAGAIVVFFKLQGIIAYAGSIFLAEKVAFQADILGTAKPFKSGSSTLEAFPAFHPLPDLIDLLQYFLVHACQLQEKYVSASCFYDVDNI